MEYSEASPYSLFKIELPTKRYHFAVQSVVQFAKGQIDDRDVLFALKFFTSRAAFVEDRRLYEDYPAALRQFMPDVVQIVENDDQHVQDPFGNALPPFIVMEKGESLRDRFSNPCMGTFTPSQARTLPSQSSRVGVHCCVTCVFCQSLPFWWGADRHDSISFTSVFGRPEVVPSPQFQ